MGVLVVRKEVNRRTSLLMGISLALLLGAAATFFIFALPQQMLETLTTTSRLSRIMVQAEPPISPNDRVLLAILAGLGTTGLGWVLVDWLLFGRAGMSSLIKPREDEYEEEGEGDAYRPSHPLDLNMSDVQSFSLPTPVPAAPVFDQRKPLSARTDIGDPPLSPLGTGRNAPEGTYDIPIDQLLPPLDRFLPDKPALTPAAAAAPLPVIPGPLVFPSAAEIAAARASVSPAMPSGPSSEAVTLILPGPAFAPDPEPASIETIRPDRPPVAVTPPPPLPAVTPDALANFFASFPPELPEVPIAGAPLLMERPNVTFDVSPPASEIAPPPMPVAPPPAAVPPPVAPAAPSRPRPPVAEASGEPERLEDLLARLEYGMQRRRPVTPPPIMPEGFAPSQPARQPMPAFAAAPAQMANIPPEPQQAAPSVTPVAPVEAQIVPPPPASGGNSGLLDQPLHIALDVLRNRMRRSG